MAETFGNILAEARMQKGLSLEQVSQDLRIRPAILAALEREDYFAMPLKGHSRNMVSSYSRYLGLDSAAVTELFLLNYREFEQSEPNRRATVLRNQQPTRQITSTRLDVEPRRIIRDRDPSLEGRKGSSASQGVRSIWDKPTPQSELRQGYDSRSQSASRSAKNAARRRPVQGSHSRGVNADVNRSSRRNPLNSSSQTMLSTALRKTEPSESGLRASLTRLMKTTPLPLILMVLAVVVLLVLWATVTKSCQKPPEGTTTLTQPTGQANADPQTPDLSTLLPLNNEDLAPYQPGYGPFLVRVEPADGTSPWVEIKVDGVIEISDSIYNTKTYKVMDSFEILTGQPDNISVYRDDIRQEFEVGKNGLGTIKMEVIEAPINDNTTNQPAD